MSHEQREPLWREELSVFATDERYVGRRQFAKFLVLTSLGMFAGNLWLLAKSLLSLPRREAAAVPVAASPSCRRGELSLSRPDDPPAGALRLTCGLQPKCPTFLRRLLRERLQRLASLPPGFSR